MDGRPDEPRVAYDARFCERCGDEGPDVEDSDADDDDDDEDDDDDDSGATAAPPASLPLPPPPDDVAAARQQVVADRLARLGWLDDPRAGGAASEQRDCPICLEGHEAIEQGDVDLPVGLTMLSCGHVMHTECAVEWVARASDSGARGWRCPVCRAQARTYDSDSDSDFSAAFGSDDGDDAPPPETPPPPHSPEAGSDDDRDGDGDSDFSWGSDEHGTCPGCGFRELLLVGPHGIGLFCEACDEEIDPPRTHPLAQIVIAGVMEREPDGSDGDSDSDQG